MEINDFNLTSIATELANLAIKGTVNTVHKRIEQYKEDKNCEDLRNKYNDLINEILQERDDAIRIAQIYKNEVDKYIISDDEIDYIQSSVEKLIEIMKNYSFVDEKTEKSILLVKDLISKDTLKVMQLLGFNYKKAIGEPLTEICARAITNDKKKK